MGRSTRSIQSFDASKPAQCSDAAHGTSSMYAFRRAAADSPGGSVRGARGLRSEGPADATQGRHRSRVGAGAMTSLPGAPFLHRRGAELWLEDVRLAALAAAHGTPL